MSEAADRLYDLLPAYHRIRDKELDEPLHALLRVIAEHVERIDENISRQYDNWFIETCENWVVPYIGDLIGYRPGVSSGNRAQLSRILAPRAEVANVIGSRRRKGTLALLELLATQVGWPARAVEFYALMAWTQHLDHIRLTRARTADLRDVDALERLGGPFDTMAHGVDIRRVGSAHRKGRYNLPSVGAFTWRLKTYSVTHAPAYRPEGAGQNCFTFSVLGNDAPLYARPDPETSPDSIASELNLPVRIRRRMLARDVARELDADVALYGEGKSLAIYAPNWPTAGAPQPVPRSAIRVADLSNWKHRPKPGEILLDPVRGRFMFPGNRKEPKRVWVDYHYAFGADIGGGEYRRLLQQPANWKVYPVRTPEKRRPNERGPLASAIEQWAEEAEQLAHDGIGAIIEIQDSSDYSEGFGIDLPAGAYLQIRAAVGTRPSIRFLDRGPDQIDALIVTGKRGSRLVLDGLLISGRGIEVDGPDLDVDEEREGGDLCDLVIRHSTLVPGWALDPHCRPKEVDEPSLLLNDTRASVTIEHSIVGRIEVSANEVTNDPIAIRISDSIVDATDVELSAVGASNLPTAFAQMTIARCTVLGSVAAHAIELAENSIFLGKVTVARRQIGCTRYCYVPEGSRTPRRFACQPDLAIHGAGTAAAGEAVRVEPVFESMRYGVPDYARLAPECAVEIRRGADDDSEMGAFHDLFEPQRIERLEAGLTEYSPTEFPAEIILAS